MNKYDTGDDTMLFTKTKKIYLIFILTFCLLAGSLSANDVPASGKTSSSRPARPKLTVTISRSKNRYFMHLYMKNVTNAKYADIRWKPSKQSKFNKQRLWKKITPAHPSYKVNMLKYKTIYIQIRIYNKKGVCSKYSNLVKVKRSDYKKQKSTRVPVPVVPPDKTDAPTPIASPENTSTPSPTAPPANTSDPAFAPSPVPTPIEPIKKDELTVNAYADSDAPYSHQTVKIQAATNIQAANVTVLSKTDNNTYGPFNMEKNGDLTWYFDAEFFETGRHQIIVTAYGPSGITATSIFTITVRSLF